MTDRYGDREPARRIYVTLPGLDCVATAASIAGIFAVSGEQLDRAYVEQWAEEMGLTELDQRASGKGA